VASLSAAERSIEGKRVKEFDADELIALCRAFELPLAFWFLPAPGEPVRTAVPNSTEGFSDLELVEVVFGRTESGAAALAEAIRQARQAFLQLDQLVDRLDPNSSVPPDRKNEKEPTETR